MYKKMGNQSFSAIRFRCSSISAKLNALNLGAATVTIPISISEGLKSCDSTLDSVLIASCKKNHRKHNYRQPHAQQETHRMTVLSQSTERDRRRDEPQRHDSPPRNRSTEPKKKKKTGYLNCLFLRKVTLFLVFLFEVVDRLLLFLAGSGRLVANIVPSRVTFEDLRPEFLVYADDGHGFFGCIT